MDKLKYQQRWHDFDTKLQELAMHDNIVNCVMQAYACGNIPTIEEAMTQMVVMLSEQNKSQFDMLMDFGKQYSIPNAIKKSESI